MLLSIANIITFSRILLIPVLSVLLWWQYGSTNEALNFTLSIWAAVFFAAAGVSDMVDGWLARKYQQVSRMGKFFDPMADKLIHMTALVHLVELGRLPAWLVVVLLFREIFISGLRAAAAGEGMIIDAAAWGKKKTAFLNVALTALIIYKPVFGIDSKSVGMVCLLFGFVYSVASAIQYSYYFFSAAAGQKGKT